MNPAILCVATGAVIGWTLLVLALIGTASSTVFLFMTLVAAARYRKLSQAARGAVAAVEPGALPPVTILKPVHGAEPRLAENLASFFEQDYPDFEIIIGARDENNAALKIAGQVRQKYPQVKSRIVLSGPPTWPSAKIFSLDKMIAAAGHSYFVISDSDALVRPDFLRNVVTPLLDPKVGLITCLYAGIPAGDFWSLLEALGMSVEMPSGVLVADMLEGMRFALGVAMATRRDALEAIGGIARTADYFSDDFVLGNEIWAKGYKVVLSHYMVGHVLLPRSLRETFAHQLLWMKSTRYSRPKGHVGTGLTYATPFGLLGVFGGWAVGHLTLALGLLAAAFVNRIIQSIVVGWGVIGDRRALTLSWLYPLRDLFGFVTWVASFMSNRFLWRGEPYYFGKEGRIYPLHRDVPSPVPERK
ncbi:MAG TPA: glycosyltransferase [Terriglobales bacterium]|nr:glycosyltransferase [Terriglobales bacterium]